MAIAAGLMLPVVPATSSQVRPRRPTGPAYLRVCRAEAPSHLLSLAYAHRVASASAPSASTAPLPLPPHPRRRRRRRRRPPPEGMRAVRLRDDAPRPPPGGRQRLRGAPEHREARPPFGARDRLLDKGDPYPPPPLIIHPLAPPRPTSPLHSPVLGAPWDEPRTIVGTFLPATRLSLPPRSPALPFRLP
jgi:hypothetical protein